MAHKNDRKALLERQNKARVAQLEDLAQLKDLDSIIGQNEARISLLEDSMNALVGEMKNLVVWTGRRDAAVKESYERHDTAQTNQASPPAPTPPLGSALIYSEKRVADLHAIVTALEDRLSPVLGETKPVGGKNSEADRPNFGSASAVNAFACIGDRVHDAEQRIRYLLERLEV